MKIINRFFLTISKIVLIIVAILGISAFTYIIIPEKKTINSNYIIYKDKYEVRIIVSPRSKRGEIFFGAEQVEIAIITNIASELINENELNEVNFYFIDKIIVGKIVDNIVVLFTYLI